MSPYTINKKFPKPATRSEQKATEAEEISDKLDALTIKGREVFGRKVRRDKERERRQAKKAAEAAEQ